MTIPTDLTLHATCPWCGAAAKREVLDDQDASARAICERIVFGEGVYRDDPLARVCQWLADEAGTAFRQQHAVACEIAADCVADEIIEIADDYDRADTDTRRRRIEALQRLAGSLAPQKYAD